MTRFKHVAGTVGTTAVLMAATLGQSSGLEVVVSPSVLVPGQSATVSVYASMPEPGTLIPWTTPPGSGQLAPILGFASVVFDLVGSASPGVAGTWSNLWVWFPPGQIPEPSMHVSGSSVLSIMSGVGFAPPEPTDRLLVFSARWQAGAASGGGALDLRTSFIPIGTPPQTGIEMGLAVPGVPFWVSQFIPARDGLGSITVIPAPGAPVWVLASFGVAARRRRRARRTPGGTRCAER